MKKSVLLVLSLVIIGGLFSCAKENINEQKVEEKLSKAAMLTKAFYDDYFKQEIENENAEGRMGNAERMEVVKRKYLTEDLIEELHLRSRENSCDAITNSQDNTVLRGKLTFENGKDENTGIAIYKADYQNGGFVEDVFELHFVDVEGKMLADELNVYHKEKMPDGTDFNYEHLTKYANGGGISEDDRKEMESIKKELDDLEAEGYIG